MPADEAKLRSELNNIKNNAFDVKEYFHLLHPQMLSSIPKNDFITAPNTMVDEDSINDFLSKNYPNQKYVLLCYAHKPHSNLTSPKFPNAPRFHTSLLLCKITNEKIENILNIDGYDCPDYVDIIGERPGATPNPNIKNRLVIQAQKNALSSGKEPLQAPSWYNLNCSIYALTFAKKILAIYAEKPDLLDNVFPKDKTLKPSKTALNAFEEEILEGMTGTYVTKNNGVFISDSNARDKHHNAVRATLAESYELQQKETQAPEKSASEQPETPVYESVKSQSHTPRVSGDFSFFSSPKSKQSESLPDSQNKLTTEEIGAVKKLIRKLDGEINSKCWHYPNTDKKKIKRQALESLIQKTSTMEVSAAIDAIEKEFTGVRDGRFSTRTADLLDSLLKAHTPACSPG